ncbi:dihydrolipoamide succinyltransferase component of 2-oxoglutarate dehydrogenase [Gregarina niphandrodes]|uniref:Dihydrolipoamide acetyltransferase component of pyruvate dehydrogenase complex n=1 Tax=Gregarina niphandrodes TaxID=110365 RepID=A0A023AYG1_GRENI|nr:dihydrolipoamide succinyltransferase component of 2-oxoglutarate dehydrogenase [Gregarina niphandrodes]EZG43712.1 dihydrolipoamide succinyltransferase component of 2-oxoglutarate dehydrogenase [Gregarina niphandrodes]|eukprot:XP_011133061.1 dihydrolipoamide succinyltransferase component of 2-oxoglutarate dehydrogenase [Gregarina niphandrodes]
MGESITEGSVQTWNKRVGDFVEADEVVAVIDTDKISVDVNAPVSGVITAVNAAEGDTVEVGGLLFTLDTEGKKDVKAEGKKDMKAEGKKDMKAEGKKDMKAEGKKEGCKKAKAENASALSATGGSKSGRVEKRVALSRMRQRIGERLKSAQTEGVLLTTFQELDMSGVMALRKKLGPEIQRVYGVKLGFMSFFIAACAKALEEFPGLNGSLVDGGKTLLERNYVDISVAVATPTGLVVPVVRDAQAKSLVELERDVLALATKARANKLTLSEMEGGTFTISNGGVYGSWVGTPIINPPQAAILGMHGIHQKPVVDREGSIVARPVMALALTYDHRIVDGKEAVTFLKRVTDLLQDPAAELLKTVLPFQPSIQLAA